MEHNDVVKEAVRYNIISLDESEKYVAEPFNIANFIKFMRHVGSDDGGLYDYYFVTFIDYDQNIGGFIIATDKEWEDYLDRAIPLIDDVLDNTAIERPEYGDGYFQGEFNIQIGNNTKTIIESSDYADLFEPTYINEQTYKFFIEIFGTEPIGVFPLVTSYRR